MGCASQPAIARQALMVDKGGRARGGSPGSPGCPGRRSWGPRTRRPPSLARLPVSGTAPPVPHIIRIKWRSSGLWSGYIRRHLSACRFEHHCSRRLPSQTTLCSSPASQMLHHHVIALLQWLQARVVWPLYAHLRQVPSAGRSRVDHLLVHQLGVW